MYDSNRRLTTYSLQNIPRPKKEREAVFVDIKGQKCDLPLLTLVKVTSLISSVGKKKVKRYGFTWNDDMKEGECNKIVFTDSSSYLSEVVFEPLVDLPNEFPIVNYQKGIPPSLILSENELLQLYTSVTGLERTSQFKKSWTGANTKRILKRENIILPE